MSVVFELGTLMVVSTEDGREVLVVLWESAERLLFRIRCCTRIRGVSLKWVCWYAPSSVKRI